jgi:hypothetical protein
MIRRVGLTICFPNSMQNPFIKQSFSQLSKKCRETTNWLLIHRMRNGNWLRQNTPAAASKPQLWQAASNSSKWLNNHQECTFYWWHQIGTAKCCPKSLTRGAKIKRRINHDVVLSVGNRPRAKVNRIKSPRPQPDQLRTQLRMTIPGQQFRSNRGSERELPRPAEGGTWACTPRSCWGATGSARSNRTALEKENGAQKGRQSSKIPTSSNPEASATHRDVARGDVPGAGGHRGRDGVRVDAAGRRGR